MITTTVSASLAKDDHANDRQVIGQLYEIPQGSHLTLFVGNREFVHPETAAHLAEYVDVLHIELSGSLKATQAWAHALRNPAWRAPKPDLRRNPANTWTGGW